MKRGFLEPLVFCGGENNLQKLFSYKQMSCLRKKHYSNNRISTQKTEKKTHRTTSMDVSTAKDLTIQTFPHSRIPVNR